jgi:hypothetical protein
MQFASSDTDGCRRTRPLLIRNQQVTRSSRVAGSKFSKRFTNFGSHRCCAFVVGSIWAAGEQRRLRDLRRIVLGVAQWRSVSARHGTPASPAGREWSRRLFLRLTPRLRLAQEYGRRLSLVKGLRRRLRGDQLGNVSLMLSRLKVDALHSPRRSSQTASPGRTCPSASRNRGR